MSGTRLQIITDHDGKGFMWQVLFDGEPVQAGHSHGSRAAVDEALDWVNDNLKEVL